MDALPTELIVAILEQVELTQLLRANEVCSRWKELEPLATRERTALTLVFDEATTRSNSLVASHFSSDFTINNDGSVEVPQWPFGTAKSQLKQWQFGYVWHSSFIGRIVARMPKLTTLEITGKVPQHLISTITLLFELLGGKLINLKLCFAPGSSIIEDSGSRRALFMTINRLMPTLRHFHFECFAKCVPRSLKLSILGRLHHFYWHTPWSINLIFPSLMQYGQHNAELQQIGIGNSAAGQKMSTLSKLVARAPVDFAAKFTTLPHFSIHELVRPYLLKAITSKFVSITSLRLHDLRQMTLGQVVSSLAPLKQLVYLQLNSHSLKLDDSHDLQQESLLQLPSVKVLEMKLFEVDHHYRWWHVYQGIFPSVEVLNIQQNLFYCAKCAFFWHPFNAMSRQKQRECARQLCKPLKNWSMLRQVTVAPNESKACWPESEVFTIAELAEGESINTENCLV